MAYKEIVSPVLDRLDSETWHVRARDALDLAEKIPFGLRVVEKVADPNGRFTDQRLNMALAGIKFENPTMVGAGWTKTGQAVEALYRMGFSGVEVGSVLVFPQSGNGVVNGKLVEKRQFMIGKGVSLNNLGFNGPGMEVVGKNLERYEGKGIPIGISLGKNKLIPNVSAPEMHALVVRRLYRFASYIALNVSSPNTPGLRELLEKGPLADNIQAVNQAMDEEGERLPLFVKIPPDLTNEATDDVIQVAKDNGVDGIIAANTTTSADIKRRYGDHWKDRAGGVSGDDPRYRKMTTDKVSHIYRATGGKMEIIGVGGVKDWQTALEKIMAGATVVQVVTAIRGEGPGVAVRINRGLAAYLDRERIHTLQELIGANHANLT